MATRPSTASRRDFVKSSTVGFLASAVAGMTQTGTSGAQNVGRSNRILLKGGTVLSLDRNVGDFERADVLIEGKKNAAVQPNLKAEAR